LSEIAALQREAEALDALLVTTEKDMVKLSPFMAALRKDLPQPEALPVGLVVEEGDELRQLLLDVVAGFRGAGRLSDSVKP
jgi:tetraacyldisaccharide-1-P 4'-kinase